MKSIISVLLVFSAAAVLAVLIGCSQNDDSQNDQSAKTEKNGAAAESNSPVHQTNGIGISARTGKPGQTASDPAMSIKTDSNKSVPDTAGIDKTVLGRSRAENPKVDQPFLDKTDSDKIISAGPISDRVSSETENWGANGDKANDFDPDNPKDPVRRQVLNAALKNWQQLRIFPEVDESAATSAGIRILSENQIRLYTDLPKSPFVDEIPKILDRGLKRLFDYFQLDPNENGLPKYDAFLICDRSKFQALGIFNGVPEFDNGYAIVNRIFAFDKKIDYYNRHLLLHELTHAFMFRYFGSLVPRWYAEGMAEYLALNQYQNGELELGYLPKFPNETPGFERLQTIQKEVRAGKGLSPEKIFMFDAPDYKSVESYSWSWGLVVFLLHHPEYQSMMRRMPYLMMNQQAMSQLNDFISNRKNRFELEWHDFSRHFDFGYDFAANRISFESGRTFENQKDLDLDAGKTWQSSGLLVKKGKTYRIRAVGRFEVYDVRKPLPCEPNGITLRYYQGEPLGKLLGTVLPADNDKTAAAPENETVRYEPKIFAVGSQLYLVPEITGTLYFRVNGSGAEIMKNKGTVKIRVEPSAGLSAN